MVDRPLWGLTILPLFSSSPLSTPVSDHPCDRAAPQGFSLPMPPPARPAVLPRGES